MLVILAWPRTWASAAARASAGAFSISRGSIRGMLEGSELGAIRQFRTGRPRVSEDPARGHVAGQVPLPPRGGEVIVNCAAGASAGMEDSVVPGIDRHVIHAPALAGEQHQISGLKGSHFARQRTTSARLLTRGARQVDSMAAKNILDEARAVEAAARSLTSVHVLLSHVPVAGGENARRTCACGFSFTRSSGNWSPGGKPCARSKGDTM